MGRFFQNVHISDKLRQPFRAQTHTTRHSVSYTRGGGGDGEMGSGGGEGLLHAICFHNCYPTELDGPTEPFSSLLIPLHLS